jgi:hypothetical protein
LGGQYAFAGATLVPPTGALADHNFSEVKLTPGALEMKVRFGNKKGRWKLLVSIVDTTQSPPVLGIIDPEIENDVPPIVVRPGP